MGADCTSSWSLLIFLLFILQNRCVQCTRAHNPRERVCISLSRKKRKKKPVWKYLQLTSSFSELVFVLIPTCKVTTTFPFISVLRREIALHDACRKNDVDAVKTILSDKIDVNCRNNVSEIKYYFEISIWFFCWHLHTYMSHVKTKPTKWVCA